MKKQIWAILAIALVVIGSAFAVTVNYLSNTTTVNTQVESPILATVSADGETYAATADLGTTYGGDNKALYVRTINQANGAITGADLTVVLTGLLCAEVTPSMGTCNDVDGDAVVVIENDYTAGETKDQTVTLTFVPNLAPGAYTAELQVLYN